MITSGDTGTLLLSYQSEKQHYRVLFVMVSDNFIFDFLLQQSSVGPDGAHGIGCSPQLNSKDVLLQLQF